MQTVYRIKWKWELFWTLLGGAAVMLAIVFLQGLLGLPDDFQTWPAFALGLLPNVARMFVGMLITIFSQMIFAPNEPDADPPG